MIFLVRVSNSKSERNRVGRSISCHLEFEYLTVPADKAREIADITSFPAVAGRFVRNSTD